MKKLHLYITAVLFIISSGYSCLLKAAVITVNDEIGQPGCDLIDAINSANSNSNTGGCVASGGAYGDDTIQLRSDQTLTSPIAGEPRSGLPIIVSTISIVGASQDDWITIQRSNTALTPNFRIFTIRDSGNLRLEKLRISNGKLPADSGAGIVSGAGILAENGILEMLDVSLNDHSGEVGGALHVVGSGSSATMQRVSFYNNSASMTGAAVSLGPLARVSIFDTTIANNNASGSGAGIALSPFNDGISLSVYNSTISGNTAGQVGAGVYVPSSSSVDPDTNIIFRNVIVSGNRNLGSRSGAEIFFGNAIGDSRYPNVTFDTNILGEIGATSMNAFVNLLASSLSNFFAVSNGNQAASLRSIIGSLVLDQNLFAHFLPVDGGLVVDNGRANRITGTFPFFFFEPGCAGTSVSLGVPSAFRLDQLGNERPIGPACDIGAIESQQECDFFVLPTNTGNQAVICL